MHVTNENKDDQIFWLTNKTGQPTVKSIYNQLTMEKNLNSSVNNNEKFWKRLWKCDMIPKWKIFVWRILNKAIATRSRIRRRGVMVEESCVLCKESQENDNHLFRDCTITCHVWKVSQLGISACANRHVDVAEWIKKFMVFFWNEDGYDSPRVRMFVTVLWSIWIHRNEVIFKKVDTNPNSVMYIIEKQIKQAEKAIDLKHWQKIKSQRQEEGSMEYVLKGYRLFVAGTWKKTRKKNYGEAAIGWCIMANNNLIAEDGQKVNALDGCQAETKAILYGIQGACQMQIRSIKIYTSSMEAFKALKNYPTCRMDLITICGDIIRASGGMDVCRIEKCKKEKTMKAKSIAIGFRRNRCT